MGPMPTLECVEPQPALAPRAIAKSPVVSWFFFFFFVSGLCSVLYELVWLRLSMAQFGVTTAMVSIVLSVFMAGLGLGSWASGKWLRAAAPDVFAVRFPALRLYAVLELLIGISAVVVPHELSWGRRILEGLGVSSSWAYYSIAGLWVGLTLIPWCALMGATIPVAMRAIGQTLPREAARSFSYLYMANVMGAVAGTIAPLALIELLGFRGTLSVGTIGNCLIALAALLLSRKAPADAAAHFIPPLAEPARSEGSRDWLLPILFLTGLTSMGMEVVWVRQFTPYLGTVVYAFASILASLPYGYFCRLPRLPKVERADGPTSRPREPCIMDATGAFRALSAGYVEPQHRSGRCAQDGGRHCAFHRTAGLSHSNAGGPSRRRGSRQGGNCVRG